MNNNYVHVQPSHGCFQVRLHVAPQTFDVGPLWDDENTAEWYAGMLRAALAKMLAENVLIAG